jgi:hypothetical protein
VKTKFLLAMGLPLALLAGCNNNSQTTAPSDAPPGSSAAVAEKKTGEESAGAMKARSDATKLSFSSEPGNLPVGKSASWILKITDAKSGEAVKDFSVVHDKLMHLIVVKKDLSWFNHLHPEYKGDGVFRVTTTLPTAGRYKLYADYTPTDGGNEVAQHEFAVNGVSAVSPKLVPDKMDGAWMTKKVVAHPEGDPEKKGGATYEVAMMPMPAPLKSGQDSMLHFQVRDAKGQPIKDLQPYLGALGHCVILSADATKYLHSHPMAEGEDHDMSKMGDTKMDDKKSAAPKGGGPDVMFHTNFPTPGIYKAWGQFMHKGQAITASFVVKVGAGETTTPAIDESKPHSH